MILLQSFTRTTCLSCRRYGRIDVQLLASLNGLLLAYGQELRPHIATLHRSLQQYMKQAWGERSVRFKVSKACRIAGVEAHEISLSQTSGGAECEHTTRSSIQACGQLALL
jgi:hypothetical protein